MHHTGSGSLAAALTAVAVAMATPAVAAPAASAQEAYLRPLLIRYSSLSSQELLTEATKICGKVSAGQAASASVPMVEHDLDVTPSAAIDIIAGAVAYLKC